jgi:nucleoid DNA-binding protein
MKDIDVIVRVLFETITEHLNKDEQVQIANFGTFALTSDIKKQLVRIKKQTNPK